MIDPVRIYTTTYCPYCVRAKQLLVNKGIPFREIDVTNDPEARAYLVKASGQRTVPQIFIGNESIGGCDDLYALDREGKLDPLVEQALKRAASVVR
jgi:glutaredoxin 3